jgi:hypothetical protein
MRSVPTTAFELRASRALAGAAGAVVLLAASALLVSGLSAPVQSAALAALAIGSADAWRRQRRPRFVAARRGQDGWWLRDGEGRDVPADLLGHARFGALLQVEWRVEGRRFAFLLAPDNCAASTRRQLCLLLARPALAQAGTTRA